MVTLNRYYWAGTLASGCWYPTQDKTITEQLALGVRYFDFDTAYIGAGHASGTICDHSFLSNLRDVCNKQNIFTEKVDETCLRGILGGRDSDRAWEGLL